MSARRPIDYVLMGLGALAVLVVYLAWTRPAGEARSDISLYECDSTVKTLWGGAGPLRLKFTSSDAVRDEIPDEAAMADYDRAWRVCRSVAGDKAANYAFNLAAIGLAGGAVQWRRTRPPGDEGK